MHVLSHHENSEKLSSVGVVACHEDDADDAAKSNEEAMLDMIKLFDETNDVRVFVGSQLSLPVALRERFGSFRRALAGRVKQFQDMATGAEQASSVLDLFNDMNVLPRKWLIYGSNISYLLKKTGRFQEESDKVFGAEAMLGKFCLARAKYVLLALKDLNSMHLLKISSNGIKLLKSMVAALNDDGDDAPAQMETVYMDFGAAIAAFDADACSDNGCCCCPYLNALPRKLQGLW